MVLVMLGGVVVSTIVALFVLPALYLRFGFEPEPDLSAEQLKDLNRRGRRSQIGGDAMRRIQRQLSSDRPGLDPRRVVPVQYPTSTTSRNR